MMNSTIGHHPLAFFLTSRRRRTVRTILMFFAMFIPAGAGATAQPQWRIFGHLLEARSRFSIAALGGGKVLVMGGFGITLPWNTVPLSTCELIDLNTETITPATPMLGARAEFVALHTPDSNIVVIGGNNGDFNTGNSTPGEHRDTLRLQADCPTALPLTARGRGLTVSGTDECGTLVGIRQVDSNRSLIKVMTAPFPNPVSNRITIRLRHTGGAQPRDEACTLYDLFGRVVARGRYVVTAYLSADHGGGHTEGEYRIDVEGVPSGSYLVSVDTHHGTETFSVVIAH